MVVYIHICMYICMHVCTHGCSIKSGLVILSIQFSFHLSSLLFHFIPNALYSFPQLPTVFSKENIASEICICLTNYFNNPIVQRTADQPEGPQVHVLAIIHVQAEDIKACMYNCRKYQCSTLKIIL